MDITTTIIVLVVIGVIMGFAIGLLIAGLRSTNGDTKSSPRRPSAAASPSHTSGERKTHVEPASSMNVGDSQESFSPPIDSSPIPEETVKPPSMNPVDILARAVRADFKPPEETPKSIVAQVDEILQERLADTPLSNRGISLQETPNGGMVVNVGLDRYDGIDTIPEAEIRQAIRAAVSEWENQISDET